MFARLRHVLIRLFNRSSPVGGLRKQKVDERDKEHFPSSVITGGSDGVDLRDEMPEVTNQGAYNSCTAHAIGAVVQHHLKDYLNVSNKEFNFSELYQWFYHREFENRGIGNVGCLLRDGFKAINAFGFVDEKWHSNDSSFDKEPSDSAFVAGALARDLLLPYMKGYYYFNKWRYVNVLLEGKPFVFGLKVDSSFQRLRKSSCYVTSLSNRGFYHAMVCVGFKVVDDVRYLIVRNSWGSSWGDRGHCYLKEDLFLRGFRDGGGFDNWLVK